MSIQVFNKALTGSFVPSEWFLLVGGQISLAWHLVTAGGPTSVEWFLEFTDDPTGTPTADREVDESDAAGNGAITMSKVIRTFQENGGAGLADGAHDLSTQFIRQRPYARVQVRVSAGGGTLQLKAAGDQVVMPT